MAKSNMVMANKVKEAPMFSIYLDSSFFVALKSQVQQSQIEGKVVIFRETNAINLPENK